MVDSSAQTVAGGPSVLNRPSAQAVADEQGGGPAPRGLAILLIGLIIALLSPVAAFLFGTYGGSKVALWLLVGIGVGALGVVLTILGGLRLYRDLQQRSADDAVPDSR